MMPRGKVTFITAMIIVVLLAASGLSVAFSTAESTGQGVVDTGSIDISMRIVGTTSISNMQPGLGYNCNAIVTNVGTRDVYVRANVDLINVVWIGTSRPLDYGDLNVSFANNWELGTDGYLYYKTKLRRGEEVSLFTTHYTSSGSPYTLFIPKEWVNQDRDDPLKAPVSFEIEVKPYAIQADHTPVQFVTWPYWPI